MVPARAHFVGIGGVGMAGLAWLLRRLGCDVSGCDAKPDAPTCAWLRAGGIRVLGAHDAAHVAAEKPDLVVRTPAVHDDNPELAAARAAGVPVVARGELLAGLSARFRTAAVCGSHGKTTTSTFLATILRALAPDETWWCIGGASRSLGAVAGCGDAAARGSQVRKFAGLQVPDGQSEPSNLERAAEPTFEPGTGAQSAPPRRGTAAPLLVAEADESDGTLALYRPALLVVTNVDLDHVDRFPSVEAFEDVFRRAIARTDGPVVYCADAPRASALARTSGHAPLLSFGFSDAADFRILDWAPDGAGGQAFSLAAGGSEGGEPPVRLHLPVPGRHNALNAAAAVAAASALGFAPDAAARALERSAALPARRFERVGSPAGFEVVSDYSHHPSEIRALVETARGVPHKRLVGVFQPHRFTRTKTFLADFPPAFAGLNALVLCPVYAASEPPLAGGTSADLYAAFRAAAARNAAVASRKVEKSESRPSDLQDLQDLPTPVYARSLDEAADWFRFNLREGDLVLVVGAGDVDSLAPRIAAMRPAERPPQEPRLSGYGTAAPVARLADVETEDALRAALADAAPAVVGACTNTVVAATGCARTVVRLRGPAFDFAEWSDDGSVETGAATPGARLLAECRKRGRSGLEALAGIPGTVGGWLAMNAGTRFGAFCDRVESVRAMGADGVVRTLSREGLRPGYRTCPGLAGFVALSVRLRLDPATPEAVDAKMRECAAKRFDFGGLRTCGSVFRNPPPPAPPAGKLADDAGCKGLRVGGAHVSDRHANVIAADPDATASDILALVDLVRSRVRAASGVDLAPEIRVLR